MGCETIFIGNESPYLQTLNKLSDLSSIVCDPIRGTAGKVFGSAHQFAKKKKIAVVLPADFIRSPKQADIIVVSGYSKRIPRKVIDSARVATVNIHQSLLPAYRGRHPLNWAIIKGETHAGVTIHHVNEGFDEGNIILQKKVTISKNDNIMDVYWKATKTGCEMLYSFFDKAKKGNLKGFRQDPKLATYFPPRIPRDGKIDWSEPAEKIYNLVRALTYPYPGAYFYYRRKKMLIEIAKAEKEGPVGSKIGVPTFYRGACFVKTGSGFLKIAKLRNANLLVMKN